MADGQNVRKNQQLKFNEWTRMVIGITTIRMGIRHLPSIWVQ